MKKPSLASGALAGLLLTIPLTAVLYLASALAGLGFTPFEAFAWVRDKLPGRVLVFGIETLANTLTAFGLSVRAASKPAEIIMVLGMFLLMGVVACVVVLAVARRRRVAESSRPGLILGALLGCVLAVIGLGVRRGSVFASAANFVWTLAAFMVWGYSMSRVCNTLARQEGVRAVEAGAATVERLNRRRFLIRIGTASAAITVMGAGLGRILSRPGRPEEPAEGGAEPGAAQPSVQVALPNAGDRVAPAPGTRPEFTPLKDHYRIDINLTPPRVDGRTWALPVTGLVKTPASLTLNDLRTRFEPMDQFITLSCISNQVAGDLIGTTRWTGVSLQKILDAVDVKDEARFLRLESTDGFSETVPLDLIRKDERIMFAYAWDGKPLLPGHGFPLRVYIPDRYGMKQPKWIIKAEFVADYQAGYWVARGWDREARVRATSVIDTVAVKDIMTAPNGDRLVSVGGIAYSGARGISRVEVKVDGGEWAEARLRQPLSGTTWFLWRFDWPFRSGSHTFTVRCRESDGTPQIEAEAGTFPSGATGLHRVKKKT